MDGWNWMSPHVFTKLIIKLPRERVANKPAITLSIPPCHGGRDEALLQCSDAKWSIILRSQRHSTTTATPPVVVWNWPSILHLSCRPVDAWIVVILDINQNPIYLIAILRTCLARYNILVPCDATHLGWTALTWSWLLSVWDQFKWVESGRRKHLV